MRKPGSRFCCWSFAALPALLAFGIGAGAQTTREPSQFANKYSLGLFVEYMPTSSPILLGVARQRRMIGGGVAVTRRWLRRDDFELDYLAEFRPFSWESDPTLLGFRSRRYGPVLYSPAIPIVDPGNLANSGNLGVALYAAGGYSHPNFSRRWTYSAGVSPFGVQMNGLKHRRVQPEAMINGGFLVSPREIPISKSSYFNFMFQFGGGIEWYRTARHSVLFEYRIQHFSNGHLGTYNPGTDGGLWKLTYRFGGL